MKKKRTKNIKQIKIMYFLSGVISGGAEQVVINYCNKLDHNKYQFIVIYQHEPVEICKQKLEEAGCKTIRITARNENFLMNLVDSYRVIKQYNPDIVHSNMNLMNFCASFPALVARVPVRISHSHIAERNKSRKYLTLLRVCRLLINLTSNVFFSCGAEASKYLYGSKKDVTIIKNAVDIMQYNVIQDDFRNELNLQDKIVLGHVGRFTEQKNQIRLLEIFNEFHKISNNSKLLLVGTGELEERIKEYAEQLGLSDNIIFLGAIKEMPQFYATLDLFLLPSLYEGFPVVALEVQAAGVKAVFSDKIDSEVQITDLVELYSLNESDCKWADQLTDMINKRIDVNAVEKLTEAGYNIDAEADKLDRIYIDSLKTYAHR